MKRYNELQMKIKSSKDGKMYITETLDMEGILRLIESPPSKKAEPFKLWLASLGKACDKLKITYLYAKILNVLYYEEYRKW